MGNELSYFCESDIRRFLPKALTADVQSVLANEAGRMGADTAIMSPSSAFAFHLDTLASGVWARNLSGLERRAEYMEEVERDRDLGNHTTSELLSRTREVLSTRLIREP